VRSVGYFQRVLWTMIAQRICIENSSFICCWNKGAYWWGAYWWCLHLRVKVNLRRNFLNYLVNQWMLAIFKADNFLLRWVYCSSKYCFLNCILFIICFQMSKCLRNKCNSEYISHSSIANIFSSDNALDTETKERRLQASPRNTDQKEVSRQAETENYHLAWRRVHVTHSGLPFLRSNQRFWALQTDVIEIL